MDKNDFIIQVADSYAKNQLSLFLGAGGSIDAGLPSWKVLLEPCARELHLDIESQSDLSQLAQFYVNKFGINKLKKIINNEINNYKSDSDLVKTIIDLGFNSIWTTNYDNVIERQLVNKHINSNTIHNEKDLANIDFNNRVNIFKINGDINDRNNIVITKKDFENFENNHHLFMTFLKRELITNTFLFIGYSFTDQLVTNMINRIKYYLDDTSIYHYAIMCRSEDPSFELFINDLKKRYNIDSLIVDDPKEIPNILLEIKERIICRNIFIAGSLEKIESSEMNYSYQLCKSLSIALINNKYNIISGFGRNIGYYITGAATEKLFENGETNIDKRLIMRPFALDMSNIKDTELRTNLLNSAHIAIFLYGQCIVNDEDCNSRGTYEEYEIAKRMGKIIIPVGSTGYSAKIILEDIKSNILNFPYLEKYINILENEKNINVIVQCIIQIIEDSVYQ